MSESFDFRDSTHFTAGAVGDPGERTFFLQAGDADAYVSVKIEKQQVSALAGFLQNVLADLPEPGSTDSISLAEPVLPEWVVGQIAVGLDEVTQEIVLIVSELIRKNPESDEPDPEEAVLRVHITPSQATSFISKSEELMKAGRPPCRLCGGPLDPEGHACPRLN